MNHATREEDRPDYRQLAKICFIINILIFYGLYCSLSSEFKKWNPLPMISTSKKHYQGFEYPKPVAQVSPWYFPGEITVGIASLFGSTEPTEEAQITVGIAAGDSAIITENAYVILIQFTGIEKWQEWLKNTTAKHKVEVCVEYEGEIKEYTFDEFFSRLGWEH